MQIIYFACYALLALAVALLLPQLYVGLPRASAWLAGISLFLAGTLLHEIVTRRQEAARNRRRLQLLHRALGAARDDLASLTGRVVELESRGVTGWAGATDRTVAEPSAQPVEPLDLPGAPPPLSRADAEERIRQSLVQQLNRSTTDTALAVGREQDRDFDAVRAALRDNKGEIYLQPIVALPQRKRRYLDCGLYLGSNHSVMIPPRRYREIASRAGYGAAVESMRLFRTVQFVRSLPETLNGMSFFCELSTHSLRDTGFFEDLLALLTLERDLTERLVLQAAAPAVQHADELVWERVARITRAGYHLSLDEVPQLDYDASGLAELGVRFMRIDADVLLAAAREDLEAIRQRRYRKALAQEGIEVIVTNIDSERTLVELLDLDIALGQGALFGQFRRSAEVLGDNDLRRGGARQ